MAITMEGMAQESQALKSLKKVTLVLKEAMLGSKVNRNLSIRAIKVRIIMTPVVPTVLILNKILAEPATW